MQENGIVTMRTQLSGNHPGITHDREWYIWWGQVPGGTGLLTLRATGSNRFGRSRPL